MAEGKDKSKLRLYTQFEHIVPTFTVEAIEELEKETGMEINTEQDLADAYRKFEKDRVANGGKPSQFKILDPPVGNGKE